MSYVLLMAFLAAGFAAGRVLLRWKGSREAQTGAEPQALPQPITIAMNVCLYGIVALLGVKIGSDSALLAQAGTIGLRALALAAGAVAGSVALVALYVALRRRREGGS